MKRFAISFIIGFFALIVIASDLTSYLFSFSSEYNGKTGQLTQTANKHALKNDYKKAIQELAEQDNIAACFYLGSHLFDSINIEESEYWTKRGLKLYEDSILVGSPEIVFFNQNVGMIDFKHAIQTIYPYSAPVILRSIEKKMKDGRYVEKLKARADQGDSLAIWAYAVNGCYEINNAYEELERSCESFIADSSEEEDGYEKEQKISSPKIDSIVSAITPYFQKAADGGNITALVCLPELTKDSINSERLLKICEQKANQGSFVAMFLLSQISDDDNKWLEKAIESGKSSSFNIQVINSLKENSQCINKLENKAKAGDYVSVITLLSYYSEQDDSLLQTATETDADSFTVDSTINVTFMRDSVKFKYWTDFAINLIEKDLKNGKRPYDFVTVVGSKGVYQKIKNYVKQLAEAGDVRSMMFISKWDSDETVTKYWKNKAFAIFGKYAEMGNETWLRVLNEYYLYKIPQDSLSAEEKAQRNHWCEKAISIYKSNIEKGYTESYKIVAELYDKCENTAAAISYMKKAVEADSTDEESLLYLGKLYYKTSNYKNAVEIFEKCLITDKYLCDSEIFEELATCYEKGLGVKKDKKRAAELRKELE